MEVTEAKGKGQFKYRSYDKKMVEVEPKAEENNHSMDKESMSSRSSRRSSNSRKQTVESKPQPEPVQLDEIKPQRGALMPAKAGGVYVPPFKLAKMMQELQQAEGASEAHQKYMWENLRKQINGIVNKVNVVNIHSVTLELFNCNLLRGKGLLAKSIMKAQSASTNFTHVFAALVAILNTKLPGVVKLILHRVLLQFQRAFKRSNRLVCISSLKMIAHLINQ